LPRDNTAARDFFPPTGPSYARRARKAQSIDSARAVAWRRDSIEEVSVLEEFCPETNRRELDAKRLLEA
jgi:hypothetical protein